MYSVHTYDTYRVYISEVHVRAYMDNDNIKGERERRSFAFDGRAAPHVLNRGRISKRPTARRIYTLNFFE